MTDIDKSLCALLKRNKITRLHAYTRKMPAQSETPGNEFQKEHEMLMQFADKQGLPLEITEETEGSDVFSRPVLKEVLRKAEARLIRCLLVYRLNSISEKVSELEKILSELNRFGLIVVEVHNERIVDLSGFSVAPAEAADSSCGKMSRQILNEGKIKAIYLFGNHLGEAPLGYIYNRKTKKLEPDKDEYTVREIFRLYLSGMNLFEVAARINQKGYRSKDFRIFTHKTIRDILTNEKYTGTQVYGRKKWFRDENGKKASVQAPSSEWIVYENAHAPIISKETFGKVQQKLIDNRITDVNSRKRTYGLTNILRCGICGRNITFYKNAGNGRTYMKPCSNIDYLTGKRCPNGACPLDVIDEFIDVRMWSEVTPLMAELNDVLAKNNERIDKVRNRINELNYEKKDINRMQDRLIEVQIAMGVSQRLIDTGNKLNYRLKEIEEELESIGKDTGDTKWTRTFEELQKDFFTTPLGWKNNDPSERNLFLKKYIDKIVYKKSEGKPDKPELQIYYTDTINLAMEEYRKYKEGLELLAVWKHGSSAGTTVK